MSGRQTVSEFSPQEAVERALAVSRSADCVVIAEETSSANLRWAGNTLTTNGVSRSRQLTVIAIDRRAGGASAGIISRAGVRADQVEDVVREAEHAAAEAAPAEDAKPLPGSGINGPFGIENEEQRWDSPPGRTEIGVLRDFATALGETLREAQATDRKLYGFAEHDLVSTFLGTSAGLRLRYDQPTGRVELNAKSADMTRSAWAGVATRDFTDVDIVGLDAGLSERLDWAKRSISLPAGRYETLLPPTAVSDLMVYLYWSAGAKDAADGRTVFSKAGGGTRVGEQLSAQPVTLSSEPLAAGLRCPPFVIAHASGSDSSVFDNGLTLNPTAWIQDGTLAALHSSRHSATLAGLPFTPAIDNLIFSVRTSGAAPTSGPGAATRDFTDVDPLELDADLAQRLAWAQRRIDLPAGRYETLLPPSAVADLLIYQQWSSGARDAAEGRTVFSRPGGGTRIGERLSQLPLTLRSDPGEPGLEAAPFVIAHSSGDDASVFDNGLPVGRVDWLREGTLAHLPTTRHSARLTGLPMAAPADNLVLEGGGGQSLADMVAATERGLLLTCLWYIREVDPATLLLTGLTRDGVYLVEGGEVTGVANNFRFNESPVDLLGRAVEAGRTERTLPREWSDYFTRAAAPALRVPDFNMSSVSQGV